MAIGTDRVQVTKVESTAQGGQDADAGPHGVNPLPLAPQEDAIESAGGYVQDASNRDEAVGWYRSDDDLCFFDAAPGNAAGHTLTALLTLDLPSHRTADQLTHDLDEDYYAEYTYSGWRLATVIIWTSVAKVLKIREYTYTWSGGRVTGIVEQQYDSGGSVGETLTYTVAYTAHQVTSITCARS
jgi:hypothetical protein